MTGFVYNVLITIMLFVNTVLINFIKAIDVIFNKKTKMKDSSVQLEKKTTEKTHFPVFFSFNIQIKMKNKISFRLPKSVIKMIKQNIKKKISWK